MKPGLAIKSEESTILEYLDRMTALRGLINLFLIKFKQYDISAGNYYAWAQIPE
jgi:hypothetical protein